MDPDLAVRVAVGDVEGEGGGLVVEGERGEVEAGAVGAEDEEEEEEKEGGGEEEGEKDGAEELGEAPRHSVADDVGPVEAVKCPGCCRDRVVWRRRRRRGGHGWLLRGGLGGVMVF